MPENVEKHETNKLGFIGLGGLGKVLALNLIDRGFEVLGYRRSDLSDFVAAGGHAASGPEQIAKETDVLLTCLPTLEALQQTVDRLLTSDGPAPIVLELGVFPIQAKQELRARLIAAGGDMLDCPVSGTPDMARNRQGIIIGSGDTVRFKAMQPILEACLDQVIYCGAFGNSSKIKYVANMLVGAHIFAAQEAIRFAEALDLDAGLVVDLLKDSGASSSQFKIRGPMMAARNFPEPLGTSSLVVKDLSVIQDMAATIGFETKLIKTILPRFEAAIAGGLGERDVAESITLA